MNTFSRRFDFASRSSVGAASATPRRRAPAPGRSLFFDLGVLNPASFPSTVPINRYNFVTEGVGDYCSAPWAKNFTGPDPMRCHSTYGTATSTDVAGPFALHTLPVVMGASKFSPKPVLQHGGEGGASPPLCPAPPSRRYRHRSPPAMSPLLLPAPAPPLWLELGCSGGRDGGMRRPW